MTAKLAVGAPAPDFRLPRDGGGEMALKDLRGRNVVLYFYPKADTPGCTLEGPAGSLKLDRGVICALRHVHMAPEDALRYGVRDKSTVRVRVDGDRGLVFGDVLVRIDPDFALAMHIDTDEANAANVKTGAQGYIEEIQSE